MNALHEDVNDTIGSLFRRHPTLCGFSVRQDLSFAEIACHPAIVGDEALMLQEEISSALHDLIDERPEAAELLRGRTVARRFH
jgi:hypothetical protein